MTLDQGVAFFIFSVVAAITPGPSNVMITATGSAVGAWRGLPCALGASAGMALLLFVVALGLGQLILSEPRVLTAMNACGGAFLLWLAWRIATAGPPDSSGAAEPVGFLGAAAFQWVNPKGWVVAAGAVSTFMRDAAGDPLLHAIAFPALFFAAALPSGLVWLVLGALMHRLLRDARRARLLNIGMAGALVVSVAMMFR